MKVLSVISRLMAGKKGLLLAAACLLGASQDASADTKNFDGLADGTVINNFYAGVTFSNALGGDVYARDAGSNAASGTNVVSIMSPPGGPAPSSTFPIYDNTIGAVDATFATGQQTVSIDAAPVSPLEFLGSLVNRPFLEAWDVNGNFLGRVLYAGALPTTAGFTRGPYETLTFTSAAGDIGKVRFSSQASQSSTHTWGVFDNLTFSAAPGGGGGGGQNPEVVPLPAAAWGGMVLLGALGGYRRVKRVRDAAAM